MNVGWFGGSGFSWSPDDQRIIFSVYRSLKDQPLLQKASIYSVKVRTRVSTRIGRGYLPLWAPRGGWIAFALLPRRGGESSLYVSRPDGSGRKVLAKGIPGAWSPDGTRIATGGLVIVQPNGKGKRAITLPPSQADLIHVDWSR